MNLDFDKQGCRRLWHRLSRFTVCQSVCQSIGSTVGKDSESFTGDCLPEDSTLSGSADKNTFGLFEETFEAHSSRTTRISDVLSVVASTAASFKDSDSKSDFKSDLASTDLASTNSDFCVSAVFCENIFGFFVFNIEESSGFN